MWSIKCESYVGSLTIHIPTKHYLRFYIDLHQDDKNLTKQFCDINNNKYECPPNQNNKTHKSTK